MDYQVSARQYRPTTFTEVIGQPHVVQTLVNAIASGRIAHAFLFSGTRGVGKTTVARILAKALNCEQGPTGTPCNTCVNCAEITQGSSVDVIEIDGASNTSVDDVREIRENVKFTPFHGRFRVYIIDEVHMLSNSAFNALLKTLEEPPAHVKFIFATTEIHKIPATILSRCQHYNFRRIPRTEIIQRLRHVAAETGVTVETRSLAAIARASEGSMRDALSLLDQAVAFAGTSVRHEDVATLLGAVPQEHVRAMTAAILAQDSPAALRVIAQLLDQGHDLRVYCADLVEHLRNLLVAAVVPSGDGACGLQGLMDCSEDEIDQIVTDAQAFSPDQLQELFRIFSQAEDGLRLSAHPRFVLETAVVRATRLGATAPSAGATASAGASPASAPRGAPASTPGGAPAARSTAQGPYSPGGSGPSSQTAPRPPAPPSPSAVSVPASKPAAGAVARPGAVPRMAPAQTSPKPAASAPVAPLKWDLVLDRMEHQHPNIAAFLVQGTVIGTEQHLVTIGYPKQASVARQMIEKEEYLRLVNEVCTATAGRSMRVRIVEVEDGEASSSTLAQIRAARERDRKQALLEQTRAHPVVKRALEIFGGELVEVRQTASRKETSP